MWNLPVLKILLFLGFYSRTDGHNSSTIERMSLLLEQFCPDDGICLSNRTEKHSHDSEWYSCCSACSCDDSCQFSKTCCFPEMSKKNDASTVLKSPKAHKTCLYPFIPNTVYGKDQRMDFNTYYMISSVDDVTSQEACGNKNVSSWGSLLPVYSKQRDLIFKNPVCAEAYGADDGVLWTPFLVCKSYTTNFHFINDGATFSLSPGVIYIPDDCYIFFKYSDDDIESHVCFNPEEFINTCKYSEFSLPTHLVQYKDEITSACTSGLISPYKLHGMYANAFCYICNEGKFNERYTCITRNIRSGSNMIGLVGLLNIEFLQLHESRTKERKFHQACRRSNIQDESCREIHCPSGKSRDIDGNCYFATKRWYNVEYSVLVNLTAAHDIDVEQVFKPGKELQVLKRMWPKHSFVTFIAQLITTENAVSKNLLVLIRMLLDDLDPNIFIASIDKMIHRRWGLFIGGEQESLHADFSKIQGCLYLYPRNEISLLKDVTFGGSDNNSLTHTLPAIKRIYTDATKLLHRWPPFYITKLYFCEQVELYDSEFVMSENEDVHVLYNKITGQYMYDGEFTLIHKSGVVTPRVCLESSGLVISTGNGNTCYGVCIVLVFISLSATWFFITVHAYI